MVCCVESEGVEVGGVGGCRGGARWITDPEPACGCVCVCVFVCVCTLNEEEFKECEYSSHLQMLTSL